MTRTAVNRILLGLAGIVLLGGGVLALIGGLDLNAHWNLGLPRGWPWTDPHQAVLNAAERTRWRGRSWWWPALFAALAVVALVCLWWLLAQLGRGRAGDLPIAAPERAPARKKKQRSATLVRGTALAEAVGADAEELPGVARARARLLGHPRKPQLRLAMTLEPGAAPGEAVRSLGTGPVARVRAAAGLADMPAEVRIRAEGGRRSRVR
ncbi:alkaline shock response membrane anchor protein AmaP [Streptacidiphilus sp. PB12-B1b]|uniref:alkaline shock response membrane anchor protein AmaP n=1 Tax=Streptacidiphilus sp. PB12-B1b TaxID=2705012 RepID=UPI0015F835AC|nr:alkaline shock response membrane anchor protein AmaP [Streptacidiphilus sp. PB12-B1b]QMU78520.1 alkaline shock response membrane anchor protein AmaP [Streptacidiphilus sp. PB12-B1b]